MHTNMVNKRIKRTTFGQLKKAKAWYSKYKRSFRMEILVDTDVYDMAEEIAKELNKDVEEVFVLAFYRLIKKGYLSSH